MKTIRLDIDVACAACAHTAQMTFHLPFGLTSVDGEPAVVNATSEPSHIIDVAQWLTLFRMITDGASREQDKVQARLLGLEAAQCLEEALRFYNDGVSDLPPAGAFFCSTSERRFRDHPEQFSRQRLLELRAKLPSIAVMRDAVSGRNKKRWWRRST
jgi:hypothetical protein